MKAQYVDHMGDDLSVVNAARVSFDKVSDWEPMCRCESENYCNGDCIFSDPQLSEADTRLIKYLARHNHWTPFAHTAITLRMEAPVPIRTQCFKHKQGFVENEESRRYIKSTPTLYYPEYFRTAPENAKQGSGGKHPHSSLWEGVYKDACEDMIKLYEEMIEDGVAPEQARFVLPQGVQVQWVWTGSLAAFARFVGQRKDPHAQREIQELADEVSRIIRPLFPVSWEALTS